MFLKEANDKGFRGEAIYYTSDGRTHSVFHQPDGSYFYRWYSPLKGGHTAKDLEALQAFLDTLEGPKPHLPSESWIPRLDWERERAIEQSRKY